MEKKKRDEEGGKREDGSREITEQRLSDTVLVFHQTKGVCKCYPITTYLCVLIISETMCQVGSECALAHTSLARKDQNLVPHRLHSNLHLLHSCTDMWRS